MFLEFEYKRAGFKRNKDGSLTNATPASDKDNDLLLKGIFKNEVPILKHWFKNRININKNFIKNLRYT